MSSSDWQDSSKSLSDKLAQRILQVIAERQILPGDHLGEAFLAEYLQVSRTPVRAALKVLAEKGVVENRPNRGYFLRIAAPVLFQPFDEEEGGAKYFQIGEDRLAGLLPDRVTESELLRRYALTRTQLSGLLRRMTQEGWVERLPGKGWKFLPVLNTEDGYIQMFQFRLVIEPGALQVPGYFLSPEVIGKLRRQQQALIDDQFDSYSRAELFQSGAYFHESIVSGARNTLMTESIRRVNQLRRLMDYRYRVNSSHTRVVEECIEHLRLLELIEQGNLLQASDYLHGHLELALQRKVGLTVTAKEAVTSPTRG